MTDYTELKKLAEAATQGTWEFSRDTWNVSLPNAEESHDICVYIPEDAKDTTGEFIAAASPDVVLGLIKELEHTTMAAEAEAKELDERNAELELVKAHCNQKALQLVAMDKLVNDLQDERDAEIARLKGHIKHIGNDALRKENHALLTALEQAEASLSDYNCDAPYGRYDADVLNSIRAVITKARERI